MEHVQSESEDQNYKVILRENDLSTYSVGPKTKDLEYVTCEVNDSPNKRLIERKNSDGLVVGSSFDSEQLSYPGSPGSISGELERPPRRHYFSDSEIERYEQQVKHNQWYGEGPKTTYNSTESSLGSAGDLQNAGIHSNEISRQLTCHSDKTTDRNWSSYQYSIIGTQRENALQGCRLCNRRECLGCRYPYGFARTRISGPAQIKHWLSLPNVNKRKKSTGFRKLPPCAETPSTDCVDKKGSTKFTRSQKMTLICVGLVNFSSFLSMSIIAPFFPREASMKGMREAVSGFVFSEYALVMMLASPVFGKILPRTGTKFMYLCGILVSGISNMLFGVLDKVDGEASFAALCFVVRSFEAIGAAAFSTASYTIILDMFPDNISTVFGILETCVGVGMSIGPAVGGAFYSVGGYGLPFFVLGGIVLVNIPISLCMMGKTTVINSKMATPSYKSLLSVPLVVMISVVVIVSSQAQGFIDPTLEPHLRQYNIGPEIVGLLFLVMAGTYALFSPAVGWIIGKWETKYPMMFIGLIMMTTALLLLGPSPLLPLAEGQLWLYIFSIALLGVSFSCSFIPTFEAILLAGLDGGLNDNMGTYCIVAGLWNSMCSLGEVAGPSLGGVLSDFLDFPMAATVMAACSFLTALLVLVAWMMSKKPLCTRLDLDSDSGISDDSTTAVVSELNDEKTSLLSNATGKEHYGSASRRNSLAAVAISA